MAGPPKIRVRQISNRRLTNEAKYNSKAQRPVVAGNHYQSWRRPTVVFHSRVACGLLGSVVYCR